MKVLQIGFGNNPGGVEAFVMNYYRELAKLGTQFDFVCMYDKIAYEEEITSLGGQVYYVPNVKKQYHGYVSALEKILLEGAYDAVHVNMLSAANIVPLRLACKIPGLKVIAHSHNASAPGIIRNIMNALNRPKIQRYANQFFACGKKAGVWLFGETAWNQGEIRIVRNAVDGDKYQFSMEKRNALRTELGWGEQFVIGHVGRFEVQKNHDKILEVFQKIAQREPKARLCLIGDGIRREEMEDKAARLNIKDKVLFAGVQTEVERYLSAMDVFLFPSLFEGLPFTLVEAQANGLPCVISAEITKEVVLPGSPVKSLSLTQKDSEWANAVLDYKGWVREETGQIRKRLEEAHFDIKKEAIRLQQLYQE